MNMLQTKVSSIFIPPRARKTVNADIVASIAASIKEIGLQNPISVVFRNDVDVNGDGELWQNTPVLVAGRHRLEALMSLGEESVDVAVFSDEVAARKWEISENLHRSDLTALERSEHIAEWVKLIEEKPKEDISRQADAKPGRPEGGVRAAARELKLSEADARRAVKVAALSPEAKTAATDSGLSDNRSALLAAAKEAEPKKQVEAIEKWDAQKEMAAIKASMARKKQKAIRADSKKEFTFEDGIEADLRAKSEAAVKHELEALRKRSVQDELRLDDQGAEIVKLEMEIVDLKLRIAEALAERDAARAEVVRLKAASKPNPVKTLKSSTCANSTPAPAPLVGANKLINPKPVAADNDEILPHIRDSWKKHAA